MLDSRVGLGSARSRAVFLLLSLPFPGARHTTGQPNWWWTAESPHQIPDGSSWSSSRGSSGTTRRGSTNRSCSSRRRRIPVRGEGRQAGRRSVSDTSTSLGSSRLHIVYSKAAACAPKQNKHFVHWPPFASWLSLKAAVLPSVCSQIKTQATSTQIISLLKTIFSILIGLLATW